MSRLYTRRAFLSVSGAAAASVGLLGLCRFFAADRIPEEGQCPKCKAFYTQAHKHKDKHTSGVYCPNCGIELAKRAYDPAPSVNRFHFALKPRLRKKRTIIWEWAQVPFPNARLIRQSDKPAIAFSGMQI